MHTVAEHVEPGLVTSPGFVGRIPVRNLWLLMYYASDLFKTQGLSKVGQEEVPDDLPDLVGEILAHAVEKRLRRQLSLGYQSRSAVIHRVRGRIDVLTTERRQLLSRGLIACQFEELTLDTPRNRFVRGALETIARVVRDNKLAYRCRSLANGLMGRGVSSFTPSKFEMSLERCGRQDSEDRFMVAAARLAFDLALPTEVAGANLLAAAEREEMWARRLFERAVGGFFAVVLTPQGWNVRCGTPLRWQMEQQTTGIDQVLPAMRTDVVLDHLPSQQRIVIDTKFTSIVTSGWHRKETLRSGYLYQIYAYLHSQVGKGDALADRASGLLLHPSVGADLDETAVIQGHSIRFATVDLTATPAEIRKQLLRLVP